MINKIILSFFAAALPFAASANGTNTSYYINSSGTTVTTEVKNAGSSYDKVLGTYMSDRLVKALKDMPTVTSVQLTKNGDETISEVFTYGGYRTRSRKGHLFVTMNLPAKVSLLLPVEESYNECVKTQTAATVADENGVYSSTSCTMAANIKISGPISVYGSHAINSMAGFSEDELKDLQDIKFELSKSYDQKDVSLRASFSVNSMMFDKALAGFLKTFKVQGVDLSVAGMTRQNVLLGTSRMVRLVNDKILEDKAGGK